MEPSREIGKIQIEQKTLNDLNTTRKWAMFLAIIGFIVLGLVIVVGLIAGSFLSAMKSGETGMNIPEWLIFILFVAIVVICFFPGLFLFRFSRHISNSVITHDKKEIHLAFKNLKAYFVYSGIMIIAVLILYVILLIFAGASMSFLKGF